MSEYIVDYPQFDHLSIHEFVISFKERVVRCRDCKEYHPELYSHISCELLGRYVEPDGFCAWGERKCQ